MSELAEFRPFFLLAPFFRRWILILALAVLGGVAGLSSIVLDPPRYEASAVMLPVQSSASGGGDLFTLASRLGIGGGGSGGGGGDITGVYDEVIRSVAFTNRFAGRVFPVGWKDSSATIEAIYKLPSPKDTLRHALALNGVFIGRKGLVWKVQVNGTIKLSFQSKDPVLSAAIVQAVLVELQNYTMEVRSQGTTQKLGVTSRNLADIASELGQAENRVAGFRSSNLGLSPEISLRLARLEREARVLEQVYATLRQSKAALEVERESFLKTFQVIESPRPALEPTYKPIKKWIPIGIVLGGMVGAMIAAMSAFRRGEFRGVLGPNGG